MNLSRLSRAEEEFALQLRAHRIPMAREFRFHPSRRWRFDFADPDPRVMLAVEIEGTRPPWRSNSAVHHPGRHRSVEGMEADCEKYAEALLLGWRVLRVTSPMVTDGRALGYVLQFLREVAP